MTRTETLTFCLECGARVTDWTDGECPDSTDKRHGPLKDVEYTAGADVVGLTLRIHDLEAALERLVRPPALNLRDPANSGDLEVARHVLKGKDADA